MQSETRGSGLEPGVTLAGRYRLLRRLGAGGMGEVWLARNLATRAVVALKAVHGSAADLQAHERLEQEAFVGARLSHRHVVRVFDLVDGPDGGRVLVMERLRGETLGRYVARRGPLPAADAVAVLAPVLSALDHAHRMAILHRDVSPENVFLALEPDGTVIPKLVDFGIARMPGGVQTLVGDVLGTPQYLAPERIRGAGEVDGRSDLFAVAVVLYEVMTGTCPFMGSTPAACLAAVLEVDVSPHELIPPPLWFALRRALAKAAYERPADAAEMRSALLAAVGLTEAPTVVALPGVLPSDDDAAPDPPPAEGEAAGRPETASDGGDPPTALPLRRVPRPLVASLGVLLLLAAAASTLVLFRPAAAPTGAGIDVHARAAASAAAPPAVTLAPRSEIHPPADPAPPESARAAPPGRAAPSVLSAPTRPAAHAPPPRRSTAGTQPPARGEVGLTPGF